MSERNQLRSTDPCIRVEGESKTTSHINSHDNFYTLHSDIYPQIDNIPEKGGV
jgi:hypothetical protein